MSKNKSNKNAKSNVKKDPTLYYFYSQGCGWCKKTEPLIDEINKEGKYSEILKLDLADETNRKIKDELVKKYNVQCGTPWMVDAETGNSICGFREKDILEKWANGEEIPQPVRPTGPPPKPPLMNVSKEEEDKFKKEYGEWLKKNDKLPNVKTADDILEMPRPKTEPPAAPTPQSSDSDLEKWAKQYDKWAKENDHLPNLIPSDQIIQRFKQMRNQQQGQQPPAAGARGQDMTQLNNRLTVLENKLDKLLSHLGVIVQPNKPRILNDAPKPPKKVAPKAVGKNVKA